MDENEIKAVSEAMNELRETGTLSAESLAKLGGSSDTAKKGLEKFSTQVLGTGQRLTGLTSQIAQGQTSFASLGGTIEATTKLMGGLLSALPLVGGAAKALAEGVGQASKFVLDQLDTMAKNYQTLGDASAGAVDGVDGLMRQFNQMGNYSLPAFTKAVRNNTLGLAAFQGTAAQGAEQLSKISGALTTGDAANRFLKLGMGLDAVGDATTEYLSTSARYGLLQGNTTEELTKKTQNYIEEVDKIARLTGQTREAQAKEAQKSLVDARFRAKIADMEASGQADQAQQLRQYVEGLGGAAGDAARALVTGIPLTKEAAAANLFANDAIRQNTLAIQDGKKATTAIADTQQALADGTTRFGKQIMYAGDAFGGVAVQAYDYKAILAEQAKAENQGLTREQVIDKMQKKQMTAAGKTTDQFVNAQLAIANTSKTLQQLGFDLAEFAIPAVDKFAEGLESVTDYMYNNFGGSSQKGGKVPPKTDKDLWNDIVGPIFGMGNKKAGLLDLIGKGESKGNYNALVYGKNGARTPGSADLTNMTIAEVQEYQKGMIGQGHASTAVGKYQMIAETLATQVKKAGLDPTKTKFDKKTQDLLAGQLIDQAGFGTKDTATVMKNLAGTWASLPKDMSGAGAHDGFNGNQVGINPQDVAAAINIAGPKDSYKPTDMAKPSSAGEETTAKSNQVTSNQTSNNDSKTQTQLLKEQNDLLRQSNAIQSKILQQAKA